MRSMAVSKLLNIPPRIFFMYLELGAIPELQDMGHGHHREYTAEQIQKIHTIWQLNQMGFTKPKAIHWADQIKALKEEVGNL